MSSITHEPHPRFCPNASVSLLGIYRDRGNYESTVKIWTTYYLGSTIPTIKALLRRISASRSTCISCVSWRPGPRLPGMLSCRSTMLPPLLYQMLPQTTSSTPKNMLDNDASGRCSMFTLQWNWTSCTNMWELPGITELSWHYRSTFCSHKHASTKA